MLVQERVIEGALEQLNSGLTRVHVDGGAGPVIRLILRSRPDLFIVTDTLNAKGARAYNVTLVDQKDVQADNSSVGPIGGYHKAVNPFRGGRI